LHADAAGLHLCVRGTRPITGPRFTTTLRAGESAAFALVSDQTGQCAGWELTLDVARRLARETQEFWWRWGSRLAYDGPFTAPVLRSALALKAMQYAPTGAIIAAPTTSLPERIGGSRNWDYRYTWLRDASFTLYAFFQLGLTEEAHDFFAWLSDTGVGAAGEALDNLYTLDGGRAGAEEELDHLEGYRRSRPVRVGNGAAEQLQLDIYGEILDSAYLHARFGGEIRRSLWRDLHGIVERTIATWEQPDRSIWEVRGDPQHFTYSKLMCWVAVDRGLRLAERFHLPHDSHGWQAARRALHRRIVRDAWNPAVGAFTQTLGGTALDASLLRMSQVRFLPDRDPRLRSTVEAIAAGLGAGPLVHRYRVEETDDGLEGGEGAFLMCSFWLADAFAHLGEMERALRLFEQLLCFGSPLELYAEEADPRTGELLGNFPQAFTHLSLIGAAVNIERARRRQLGVQGFRSRSARGRG
jgi:GH15 family glucan-1,4-alpha-glucosidase